MFSTITSILLAATPISLPVVPYKPQIVSYFPDSYLQREMLNGEYYSHEINAIGSDKYKVGTALKVCVDNICVVATVTDNCLSCEYGVDLNMSKTLYRFLSPTLEKPIKATVTDF